MFGACDCNLGFPCGPMKPKTNCLDSSEKPGITVDWDEEIRADLMITELPKTFILRSLFLDNRLRAVIVKMISKLKC